jgi:hypothetical protein
MIIIIFYGSIFLSDYKFIFFGLNCTLLKENPLKMSEFLKNKYFFNEKDASVEVVLPEFLKNNNFVKCIIPCEYCELFVKHSQLK